MNSKENTTLDSLISPEYRELQKQMHREKYEYGTSGKANPKVIKALIQPGDTVLDYGCGKRTLEQAMDYPIINYDPAIPGCDSIPDPADIVYCGDVLEHIEPDKLDAVLADLVRVTKR